MTFEDARAELKKIAGGRYRSLRYTLTEDEDGILRTDCMCYVDGICYLTGSTWREALDKMNVSLNPLPVKRLTADEAPVDESAI